MLNYMYKVEEGFKVTTLLSFYLEPPTQFVIIKLLYLIIREVEYLQTSALGWQLSVHIQVR